MSRSRDARLANVLGALATGLADRMQAATVEAAQLDGSAPAALIALLDFAPHGSVHRLSQVVGLTHSGGVRLVDRLCDAGLVERGPGSDARSITVSLTGHGATVAQRVRDGRADAIAGAIAGMSDRERDELLHACELIVENVTRDRLAQRSAGGRPTGGALCRMCDFRACGRPDGDCPAARTAAATEPTN